MWEEAFSVRVVTLGEVSQRRCEVSVLGDTWNPSGHGPGACSGWPCAEQGLGQAALQPPLGFDPGKHFAGEEMRRQRNELSFSANTNQTALNKNIATACKT